MIPPIISPEIVIIIIGLSALFAAISLMAIFQMKEPVIGVILMVAITVILAVVIVCFIFESAPNTNINGCVYEKTSVITYHLTGAFEEEYFTTSDSCTYPLPYNQIDSQFRKLNGHNITFTYDSTNHVVALVCDHGYVCQPTPVCTPVPTPTPSCGCGV